jgi:hypothetical protein
MSRALSVIMGGTVLLGALLASRAAARDIARYETRGPYVLHERVIKAEDRSLIDAQMRDFLLTCWEQHRLGRLITLEFSIEGLPTRRSYFIEPDEKGTWRVVIETIGTLPGVKPGTDEHYTREFTAVATLKTEDAADGKKRVRVISDGRTLLEL